MSCVALRWAIAQRGIPAGPKLLLLTLADYAADDGVCFVGREALASDCGECRPATISAHMRALERAGLVQRRQRRRDNGSRTSDWTVLAPRAVDRGEMADAQEGPKRPWDICVLARTAAVAEVPPPIETVHADQLQLAFDDVTCDPPEESGADVVPGQVRISGSPEPSGEPPATAVCEDAPANDPADGVQSPSLGAVMTILTKAGENAYVDEAHVDIVLRSFPHADHLEAAGYVLLQLLQPDCRCRAASLLLHTQLKRNDRERRAALPGVPHGGRRRAAPPLKVQPVSPAGRRWGPIAGNKYDRAAGLTP